MDDREVVEAFVDGAREAFGPTLHIEGDVLFLSGWWQAALRLAPDAFIVRNEPPREDSPVIEQVSEALAARGLREVGTGHPLIQPITYAELSLAGVEWSLWAPDAEIGERVLADRAGAESVPRDLAPPDLAEVGDFGSELEGARRIAGLPPSVVLTVGLAPDRVRELQVVLPECRFESRDLGEMAPEECGNLRPGLVVIDATGRAGREFVMELRAAACGRFLPVAAVTDAGGPPPGADIALDPRRSPGTWREELLRLLP